MRDSAGRSQFSRLAQYVLNAQGRNNPATWSRTADYVLDTAHQGAKVGTVRVTHCVSDDPAMAVAEITATQARNTRSKTDKTYHLVVSFPPGERPDAKALRYIEDELCASIGYQNHQRISAVHTDTDHLHLHVAINKVHPQKFSNIEPYFDYRRLMETCARLEIELNLTRTHTQKPELTHETEDERELTHERTENLDPRAAAALRKSYLEEIAREPQAQTLNGVRTLSSVGVVLIDDLGEVLLPGDASHHVESAGPEHHDRVRRGSDGPGGEGAGRAVGVAPTLSAGAERMQAMSSRQSLLEFVQEHVRQEALRVESWEELHAVLAQSGLKVQRRGAGLVIGTRTGIFVKASDVDRGLSLPALTRRLGAFSEAGASIDDQEPKNAYRGDPLQKSAQSGPLFAAFELERTEALAMRAAAKARLQSAHRRYGSDLSTWYETERQRIRADSRLRGRVKWEALKDLSQRKRRDFRARRELEQEQWREVRRQAPLPTWQAFLERRAAAEDLQALELLRSRARSRRPRSNSVTAERAEEGRSVVFTHVHPQTRKNGDLVYRLKDSGTVVDTARAIRVEAPSEDAMKLAISLAAARFRGQHLHIEGGADFGLALARTAGTYAVAVMFADATLESERRQSSLPVPLPEAPTLSPLETYLAQRNDLRSRVSSLDFHREFVKSDAGTQIYAGQRHLNDGSTVLLLQSPNAMLVLPVSGAQAVRAQGWAIGSEVHVDEGGEISRGRERGRRR
jgi:hypothetical protein